MLLERLETISGRYYFGQEGELPAGVVSYRIRHSMKIFDLFPGYPYGSSFRTDKNFAPVAQQDRATDF